MLPAPPPGAILVCSWIPSPLLSTSLALANLSHLSGSPEFARAQILIRPWLLPPTPFYVWGSWFPLSLAPASQCLPRASPSCLSSNVTSSKVPFLSKSELFFVIVQLVNLSCLYFASPSGMWAYRGKGLFVTLHTVDT